MYIMYIHVYNVYTYVYMYYYDIVFTCLHMYIMYMYIQLHGTILVQHMYGVIVFSVEFMCGAWDFVSVREVLLLTGLQWNT